MENYNKLKELSTRTAEQVIELVRTMTPDKMEKYIVQNFFLAANAAGGYIKSLGYNTEDETLKKRLNKALEEVCKAMYCLEMLNHMAVVDIACYEKAYTSYENMVSQLTFALNSLNSQK